MQRAILPLTAIFLAVLLSSDAQIPKVTGQPTRGDAMLAAYFRDQVTALSTNCLADVSTLDDWKSRRAEYRRELQEMLGLWPMPERTDLDPVVTGRITNDEFTVEKVYFQALPKLYVTADLYLPKNLDHPAPAVLYECGHGRAATNGVSLGNKTLYQQDGEWFARNGYVCLAPDTVLGGEIEGIHTGTRDHGLWWWNSRGYTPAGVEAWIGIRALDYLCTRPEVDTNRIGITGHSGGGAYSWTVTALDDRIRAAAPLAGMADAQSHMLDGVIDSHCDCNFFVNIYHWDFPQVATLAAPRPLLIGGTDRDPLFHPDSTMRIYGKVRRIYELYGATTNLGLAIAPGLHQETPELQLAVLRWFNRYLKGEEPPVAMAVKKFLPPVELKVFETLPADNINSNIADSFVPRAKPEEKSPDELRAGLRAKVFTGWPEEGLPLDVKPAFEITRDGLRLRAWDFTSQPDVSLRLYLLDEATATATEPVSMTVLDPSSAAGWLADVRALAGGQALASENLAGEFAASPPPAAGSPDLAELKREVLGQHQALAFFAPRGAGLTEFSGGAKRLTGIRRRFMLLGQTLDGMRVWDIRRAVQALQSVSGTDPAGIGLQAQGGMAVNALYAALFEPAVRRLDLAALPKSHMDAAAPDYLNVLKITDIPEVTEAVAGQAQVQTR